MAEKVVIYRLGTLGDTVVALPCFHLIARVFPNAARLILTNEVTSSGIAQPLSILSGSGLVHDSIAYPLGLRSPNRLLILARTLRSFGADTLIYLTESKGIARTFRDVAFFRFAGFTRIIGAPLSRDLAFNRVDPVTGIAEQEPLRLGRTLHELGAIDFDDPNVWSLNLTDLEHRAAAPFVQAAGRAPIIAINHGGKVAQERLGRGALASFPVSPGTRVRHACSCNSRVHGRSRSSQTAGARLARIYAESMRTSGASGERSLSQVRQPVHWS